MAIKLEFASVEAKKLYNRTPKRLIRKGGKRLFAMRKGKSYLITLSDVLPKTLMANNGKYSFQIS